MGRAAVAYVPEKAVEVSVPHVLEHHGQRLSVGAHAVESHDVLVLEHRQQLRLPLEVLPGRLVGILQGLLTHILELKIMESESEPLLPPRCVQFVFLIG